MVNDNHVDNYLKGISVYVFLGSNVNNRPKNSNRQQWCNMAQGMKNGVIEAAYSDPKDPKEIQVRGHDSLGWESVPFYNC